MKPRQLVLVPLLLPPLLHLCLAASHAAGPADEATVRGEPIFKEDFERCEPRDKVLFDESQRGFWNLRCKTWGDNNLLHGSPEAPDITYDPALKGVYDIEVESRATDRPGNVGLKLASESEFTILEVPNQGATATEHFNVWLPFRKNVRLDGEKLVFRCTGKATYIDALKFIPVSRFKKFRPLAENEPGPSTGVICKQPGRYIGWPTIVRTSKGELIVTFSGDRDAHVCPWGKTQMVRSRDNGKTWSDVVTINNTPSTTGTQASLKRARAHWWSVGSHRSTSSSRISFAMVGNIIRPRLVRKPGSSGSATGYAARKTTARLGVFLPGQASQLRTDRSR